MTFAKAHQCLAIAAVLAVLPFASAQAYIGPGAGMSAVGSVLGIAAALAVAVFGFVWYPLKRLRKRSRTRATAEKPPS